MKIKEIKRLAKAEQADHFGSFPKIVGKIGPCWLFTHEEGDDEYPTVDEMFALNSIVLSQIGFNKLQSEIVESHMQEQQQEQHDYD